MSSGIDTNVSGDSDVKTLFTVHDLPAVVHDDVPVGLLVAVLNWVMIPSESVTLIR
jgi:hypothetical protein